MLKHVFIIGFTCSCFATAVFAQTQQAVDFLTTQFQKANQERDQARKELLLVESQSAEQVRELNQAQLDLRKKLNISAKEMLTLKADAAKAAASAEKAQQALQSQEVEIQSLKKMQAETQAQFDLLSEKIAAQNAIIPEEINAEAKDLRKEQKSLQKEIEDRDEKLAKMERVRDKQVAEFEELQSENAQLSQALSQSQRAESLANAKLDALNSRLDNLQQELAQQFEERSELEQEQERLRDVIGELHIELLEVETNRVPKAEMDALVKKLSETQAENQKLRNELSQLENTDPQLKIELEKVTQQRDLLQSKEDNLMNMVDQLEARLAAANESSKNMARENHQLKNQLKEAEKVKGDLQSDIQKLEKIMQEAKSAGIKNGDLEEVALLVAELEREKEQLHREIDTYRGDAEVLKKELSNQQSAQMTQIRDLQNMLSSQIDKITGYERQITALEARSKNLDVVRIQKAELLEAQTQSKADMRTLAKHIFDLRTELGERKKLEQQAALAIENNKKISAQFDVIQREMKSVKRLNDALASEYDTKDNRIKQMRLELETERARQKALVEEKNALMEQLKDLKQSEVDQP